MVPAQCLLQNHLKSSTPFHRILQRCLPSFSDLIAREVELGQVSVGLGALAIASAPSAPMGFPFS